MPSPVTTSGFQVQEMPRYSPIIGSNVANLTAPDYSDTLNNIVRGAQVLRDLNVMQPLREKAAQLNVQAEQNRMAMPQIVSGNVTYIDNNKPDLGNAADYNEEGERIKPPGTIYGDLVRRTERQAVVNGKLVNIAPLEEVVETGYQREQKAKAAEAINAFRANQALGREGRILQYIDKANEEGDTETANILKEALTKARITPEDREVTKIATETGLTADAVRQMRNTEEGAKQLKAVHDAATADKDWVTARSGTDPNTGELVLTQQNRKSGAVRQQKTGLRPSTGVADALTALIGATTGRAPQQTQASVAAPQQPEVLGKDITDAIQSLANSVRNGQSKAQALAPTSTTSTAPAQSAQFTVDMSPRKSQGATGGFSAQDAQAYKWATTHPDDPRAKQILARLGIQ